MRRVLSGFLVLSVGVICFQINAQVINLGNDVHPNNVSNGGIVTGSIGSSYFKWDSTNGINIIGSVTNGEPLSGTASVSTDGNKISATITNPASNMNEMALYDVTTQSWTFLGGLSGSSNLSKSSAHSISSDGKTIVGLGWFTEGIGHPIKWTQETSVTDMGSTVTGRSARANAVNANGSVIGGWQDDATGYRSFSVWKNGVQTLVTEETEFGTLPLNEVADISDNGIWAVGSSIMGYATIWSEATGVIKIEHPEISLETGFSGAASAVNADGTMVVGYFRNLFVNPVPTSGEGFIWTPSTGRIELNEYAQSLGIDTEGVKLSLPMGISPNGKYITGWGMKDNNIIGFRLELPEAPSNCSKGSVGIALADGNDITGTLKVADDFVVETGKKMTINQVRIKTAHLGGSLSTIAFNFYKDNAGLPGDLVATVSAMAPTSLTQVETYYGYPVYEVVADLSSIPVVLNEGTYWLQPAGTGSGIYWGTTSTNTGGSKTALKSGSGSWQYTSLATAYSIFEVSGICEDTPTMGTSDIKSSNLSYYPNPVKDVLNIASDKKVKDISVYNTAGQLVLATDKIVSGQVNVSALPSGVYIFSTTLADGEVKTFKIIKN